jgi:hypothetical protein
MDRIQIEVLKDGTAKSTTDAVSGENHQSAEAFLKMVASLLGGSTVRRARGDAPQHAHAHAHGEHTHSH